MNFWNSSGLWVAIFAGVMSACMAFAFAAGEPIGDAALAAGAFDYLNKPTDPEDLERVVREALERRAESGRLHGTPGGQGGPIPIEALAEDPHDLEEAALDQEPAGVPAFREKDATVCIQPPPSGTHVGNGEAPSLLARLRRLFGRGAA